MSEIIKINTYTIIEQIYDDGSKRLKRVNDGYEPIYLLGLLEWTQKEIIKQMEGMIKPDIIERNVVED